MSIVTIVPTEIKAKNLKKKKKKVIHAIFFWSSPKTLNATPER